jgi:hypothetical protein
MQELFEKLTVASPDGVKWVDVVRAGAPDFLTGFQNATTAARAEKNEPAAQLYELLWHVFSMRYRDDKSGDPYVPMHRSSTDRTAVVSDFTEANLDVMAALIGKAEVSEFDARLADMIWLRRKDVKMAELAIRCNLEVAKQRIKPGGHQWVSATPALKRAVQLWTTLGYPDGLRTEVMSTIDGAVRLDDPEPTDYYRVSLMRSIIELRAIEKPAEWLDKSYQFAQAGRSAKDFDKAIAYFDIALSVAKFTKADARKTQIKKDVVDAYIEKARHFRSIGAAGMMVSHHYEKAIEIARQHGGLRPLIDELHKELLVVNAQSTGEMKEHGFDFDLTDVIKSALENIKDDTPEKAFEKLSGLANPQKKDALKANAEKSMAEFVFQSLVSTVYTNEKGRTVARGDAALSREPNSKDAVLQANMIRDLALHQSVSCPVIDRVRVAIINRWPNPQQTLIELVSANPFVPPSRRGIFVRGLMAGLDGDWLSCGHILIPQLENSIRHFMEQSGAIVTHMDGDQIQSELDLNTLLYRPEAEKIFGENLVFGLRVLLVEQLGKNARNRLAHGLLSDQGFSVDPWAYVWATSLKLCYLGQTLARGRVANPNPPPSDEED